MSSPKINSSWPKLSDCTPAIFQSNVYISRINIIEWSNNFYSLSQCYKGYIIKSFVEQYTSLKTTLHVKNFSFSEYSARKLKVSRWKTNGKGNPQTNNQNNVLSKNKFILTQIVRLYSCHIYKLFIWGSQNGNENKYKCKRIYIQTQKDTHVNKYTEDG
jgi:hypothetical protein